MSLNATAMLLTSHNPINRRRFFLGFEKLKNFGGSFTDPKQLHKRCIVLNIAFLMIFIINVGLLNYGMFFTHSFDIVLTNFINEMTDQQTVMIVKGVNVVVTL